MQRGTFPSAPRDSDGQNPIADGGARFSGFEHAAEVETPVPLLPIGKGAQVKHPASS